MASARVCGGCDAPGLQRILSLGDIPLVNAFVTPQEAKAERAFPLNLAVCPRCALVQLEDRVPPQQLFSHYLHLSSASAPNVKHLEGVAALLRERFRLSKNSRVLEIGCNDGTLLGFLRQSTPHLLGVDPAENLAPLARERGIDIRTAFFSEVLGKELARDKGPADLVVALNVVPHTENFVDLLRGVRAVLNKEGTFVMEAAYVIETILRGEFDTIYHEHVYCFSVHALQAAMRRAGLEIVDVEKIPTQGGSIRVFAVTAGSPVEPSSRLKEILQAENRQGISRASTYAGVDQKVQAFRIELRRLVAEEKKRGGKLVAIGAPARGVVIVNYAGLGVDDVEAILDDTTLKQGRLTPGVHIPVRPMSDLARFENRTLMLLSWNYRDHLLQRVREVHSKARVIVPFPRLEVVPLG